MDDGPTGEPAAVPTIDGRLLAVSGRPLPEGITVWLAYRTLDDEARTVEASSTSEGEFAFELPEERLRTATIGAVHEGVAPVELHPNGATLAPGNIVLVVDDVVPSHLRYGIT